MYIFKKNIKYITVSKNKKIYEVKEIIENINTSNSAILIFVRWRGRKAKLFEIDFQISTIRIQLFSLLFQNSIEFISFICKLFFFYLRNSYLHFETYFRNNSNFIVLFIKIFLFYSFFRAIFTISLKESIFICLDNSCFFVFSLT